ncbi:MAG: hypothetical protein ACRD2C_14475 [Acidimicrobiales bacterium]
MGKVAPGVAVIGRAGELAAIEAALDQAGEGSGGVVLVEGEAGICARSGNGHGSGHCSVRRQL